MNSRKSQVWCSCDCTIKVIIIYDQTYLPVGVVSYTRAPNAAGRPTTLMLGDYFTKPLQGNLFRRFRDVIMGKVHINDLLLDSEFKIKERDKK